MPIFCIQYTVSAMDVQKMRIINDAAASGATALDIRCHAISSPPDLSHLTALQKLNISHNYLQTLPSLPQGLQILNVCYNRLHTLLDLPRTLQILNISHNQLHVLPELYQLTALQELNAMSNRLQTLPHLPLELRVLNVAGNIISALPELSHLTALHSLDASSNELQILPSLPHSLRALNVSHNDIRSLPAIPRHLQALNIADNRIRALSDISHIQRTCICINPIMHSHINNDFDRLDLAYDHGEVTALRRHIQLFTDRATLYGILPGDVTGIIGEYVCYVPVGLIN